MLQNKVIFFVNTLMRPVLHTDKFIITCSHIDDIVKILIFIKNLLLCSTLGQTNLVLMSKEFDDPQISHTCTFCMSTGITFEKGVGRGEGQVDKRVKIMYNIE